MYKNQLSRQTGSRNLTGPKMLLTIWYTYMTLNCDQISDFCHQQLLRKMRQKISWTDGRTDRGKTVYPPPPSGSRGIKITSVLKVSTYITTSIAAYPI